MTMGSTSGKSTAKKVQARVEKIELCHNEEKETHFYHPTILKWSGEYGYDFVDIIPKSYFFLDVFYAINETIEEVIDFNYNDFRREIDKDTLEKIVKKINPIDDVYWNVWVDNSYDRGIPKKFYHNGLIVIHIIVNAENCSPMRLEVNINWDQDKWKNPNVKVLHKSKVVYE